MIDTFQEHCDYEANARFDYISEAYAATALDPWQEGYCDYAFDAEEAGEEVLGFDDWKARERARQAARRAAPPQPITEADLDDFPF